MPGATGHVWLIGPSGVGKSTLGPPLAAALALPFHDLDAELVAERGLPLAEQFARDGEAAFRAREATRLAALAAAPAAVIALGAGAPLDPASAARLRDTGRCLLLDARPATLAARLGPARDRPLLADAGDLVDRLAAQRAARDPAYRALAAVTLATDGLAPSAVLAAALAGLARASR